METEAMVAVAGMGGEGEAGGEEGAGLIRNRVWTSIPRCFRWYNPLWDVLEGVVQGSFM